jgi:serine/threonine protein kinase
MKLDKKYIFETPFETYSAAAIRGEGGAGRIFEVTDESGEKWAVKLLDSKKATKDKIKRFKNELEFCRRNQHANIVSIVDYGTFKVGHQSSPFYVMPLYSGSLRTLIVQGIPSNKVLPLFDELLSGVQAAHLQKVVHRDLKPENILYDEAEDHLLVADFGIARFEEEDLYTTVETGNSRLPIFNMLRQNNGAAGLMSMLVPIYIRSG